MVKCPHTVEASSPGAVLGTAASVLAKTVSEPWIELETWLASLLGFAARLHQYKMIQASNGSYEERSICYPNALSCIFY